MEVLGIDIGGSGIKGARVDTATGELLDERLRLDTPQPATPDAVAAVVAELVAHFEWTGPVGVGFPAVVRDDIVLTASNIDSSWVGVDAVRLFQKHTPRRFAVANDADVAGLAEMRFGAGRGHRGVVLILTLGTGIGSALFVDGTLVPNTEFGHLEVDGLVAEKFASATVRKRQDLDWEEWAERLSLVLGRIESLIWPDLIILGGGVSKRADNWMPYLEVGAELVVAELRNMAGIVGAGLLVAERSASASSDGAPRRSIEP